MILIYAPSKTAAASLETAAIRLDSPYQVLRALPRPSAIAELRGTIEVLLSLDHHQIEYVIDALQPRISVVFGEMDLSGRSDLVFTGQLRSESYGCPLIQAVTLSVLGHGPIEAVPAPTRGPQVSGGSSWGHAPGWPPFEALGDLVHGDSVEEGLALLGEAPLPLDGSIPGMLPAWPVQVGDSVPGVLITDGTELRLVDASDVWYLLLGYPDHFPVPRWDRLLDEPAPCLVTALLKHLGESPLVSTSS